MRFFIGKTMIRLVSRWQSFHYESYDDGYKRLELGYIVIRRGV